MTDTSLERWVQSQALWLQRARFSLNPRRPLNSGSLTQFSFPAMHRELSFRNEVVLIAILGLWSCASAEKKSSSPRADRGKTTNVQFWEGVSTGLRYGLGLPMMTTMMILASLGGASPEVFGTYQDIVDYTPKKPE